MDEPYVKVRTQFYPNGEQTRYRVGTVPSDTLEDDIIDERAQYAQVAAVQSVDDAARSVVALYEDGTVRVTHYRGTL